MYEYFLSRVKEISENYWTNIYYVIMAWIIIALLLKLYVMHMIIN